MLAKCGVLVPMSDLFGVAGRRLLEGLDLPKPYAARIASLRRIMEALDWARLLQLGRAEVDLAVIAVLAPYDVAGAVRAVNAGAVGVLPRDATTDETRTVLTALAEDRSALPIDVLRGLTQAASAEQQGESLSAREIGWLRDLAHGATVARIASDADYSERMMFRLLRDVYERLGVRSRVEALTASRDRGLI